MSNSLRDQLIKLGLATSEQAQRARSGDRKRQRQAKQQKRGGRAPQTEAARLAAEAVAREKERSRELNRQRQAEAERLASEAQARDLVVKHEIVRRPSDKDVGFNFVHDGKIKQIYVSPELRRQLVEGKVAIGRTRGRFRVVPVEVARKVQPIAPYLVVFLSDGTGPEETEDPAYAEHPIPDDLTW